MADIIKLHVHRNTKLKRERRQVYAALRKIAHSMPKDMDGFILVSYKRDGDDIHTSGHYYVRDPMDRFGLPDMAASIARRMID